jgi:hypothetical protein
MEIVATRTFNVLYVTLDLIWLAVLATLLIVLKRRLAVVVGLAAGLLYFVVDYGIFYALLGTRVVTGAPRVWVLIWLSFSYGFTNFAWIWLLLDRDGHAVEWSAIVVCGWIAVALLSQGFGARLPAMLAMPAITTTRGTAVTHAVMALILLVGYVILAVRNVRDGSARVNLLWLLAIGIGVQFSWEAVLLLGGIRPAAIAPLVVNSLIETNLGLPYAYLIHRAVSRRYTRDLRPVVTGG